jgi:hypothetical protein
MSDAELEEKFRSLAGDLLPKARVDALLEQIWTLDERKDVRDLIAATKL